MTSLRIGDRAIGRGHRVFVIAEVAQAHDGSLGTAHAYIDAIAVAGADAVKFQTHIAAAESTARERFRINFSHQDVTRYDYWERMEFTEEQWIGLAEHARDKGLIFLSSAFSEAAIDLLERLGMQAWKVGSGEIASVYLVERMARTRKPVLLSTGMATWADIDATAQAISAHGAPYAIFQCASKYPCPPRAWGLNAIDEIRRRYGCPVGFSDHSGAPYAGLAAAALGADLLEVHVAFSRECFGPDVVASVTTGELRMLVDGIRAIRESVESPVDKDTAAVELEGLRALFAKSIVAARDLSPGHRLMAEDLAFKKPGSGANPSRAGEFIGRRLRMPVTRDALITEEIFDNE
ncbi:MAG: N-acetylneuraminate synthase family protein [Planctomycetes bacterium]|nr:N-acetylneuraminate synthase family protein [Planctomycetota bacterium]